MLDSSAAALACMQPKSSLKQLTQVFRKMENTSDLHEFAELDVKFHEAIIVASGNRLFHLIFQALTGPIQELIESRLRSSQEESREITLRQHGVIVDAIQSGDAYLAATMVREHLQHFYTGMLSRKEQTSLQSFVQAMETGSGAASGAARPSC